MSGPFVSCSRPNLSRWILKVLADEHHFTAPDSKSGHTPLGHTLVRWAMLLPPGAGEGWDGGHAQAACGQALHPHPDPPPSQGEGSLCANLMWSDLAHQASLRIDTPVHTRRACGVGHRVAHTSRAWGRMFALLIPVRTFGYL